MRKNDKKQSSSHTVVMKEVDSLKLEISKIQQNLQKLNISEADEKQIRTKVFESSKKIQQLSDELESLQANLRNLLNAQNALEIPT